MPVAQFYSNLMAAMAELGLDVGITTTPCEIADPIPFDQDRIHAAYDREYAGRFWRILLSAHDVFAHFRTGFLGKASPVHFFWGSFDLAVTRFSGRRAPLHPGGVPHLPDAVAREAYSHEVSSAGFWPGGGGPIDEAAFYSYAYPAPEGFARASVPAGRGGLLEGPRRIHPAIRSGEQVGDAQAHADGLFAGDLRRSGRPRAMGPRRTRLPIGGARPAAAGVIERSNALPETRARYRFNRLGGPARPRANPSPRGNSSAAARFTPEPV